MRYKRNFVELYNRSNAPVSLAGLSVQAQSFARTFDASGSLRTIVLPNVTVPSGGYFLIGTNPSRLTGGPDLPTVDLDAPATFALGENKGKVAIVRGTTPLNCGTSTNRWPTEKYVDLFAYGYGTESDYEGTGAAIGAIRRNAGCRDTNDNASDIVDYYTAPVAGRSLASPVRPCPTTVGEGLVISQVYGNGGQPNALYARNFIELFNRSGAPISFQDLSVQFSGFFTPITPLPDVLLPPGGYFLIGFPKPANAEGTDFAADLEVVQMGAPGPNSEVCVVARVRSLLGKGGLTSASPDEAVDLLGVGAATFEGNPTPQYSETTAAVRKEHGCTDTDNNAADFDLAAPEPRSTLTLPNVCPGAVQPDAGPDGGEDGGADAGVIDPTAGDGLVISQVYTGGGGSDASFNRDYVEIFNRTSAPISLAGLSL